MKLIIVSALILMFAGPSVAQEKGTWELGADAGIALSFISELEGEQLWPDGPVVGGVDSRTDFHAFLPGSSWRLGYFLSSSVSLELPLAIGFTNYGDGYPGAEWSYALTTGLGMIYNLESGFFAGVRGEFTVADVSYPDYSRLPDPDALMLYALGATLGLRQRVFADNIRFRLSLDYEYWFEEDEPALRPYVHPQTSILGLTFGFSILI